MHTQIQNGARCQKPSRLLLRADGQRTSDQKMVILRWPTSSAASPSFFRWPPSVHPDPPLFLDWLRLKRVQLKSKAVAKMSHYTGPLRVMTVREVSSCLRAHPSTIYRMLKHHQIPAFHVAATGASTSRRSTVGFWGRSSAVNANGLDPGVALDPPMKAGSQAS